jgi:hypothetical protein
MPYLLLEQQPPTGKPTQSGGDSFLVEAAMIVADFTR